MTGYQLRTIRDLLEISQAKLSRALGVTSNTVARWERGERGISEPVSRLVQLIFLDDWRSRPATNEEAQRVLEKILQLADGEPLPSWITK